MTSENLKVLHAAQMRKLSIGFIRQMEYEKKAADYLQIPWSSKIYLNGAFDSPVIVGSEVNSSRQQFQKLFYTWLEEQVEDFDVLFLRYKHYDFHQYRFVRKTKIPVITMHHTLEVPELHSNKNVRSTVLAEFERIIGKLTLKHCSAIAGVTQQIAEYEKSRSGIKNIPIMTYSNGVWFEQNKILPIKENTPSPEFIFLSSSFPTWLGLDLLIDNASRCGREFIVHVVGKLSKNQSQLVGNDSRFVPHGLLSNREISKIMSRCILGLGTFGAHRKNFTEGNTLKVREYLLNGLPVYSGQRESILENFPYFSYGPPSFDHITKFAEKVADSDRKHISKLAQPLIDKKVVLLEAYNNIESIINN